MEFLNIAAGDDDLRLGVRSGFESILGAYEHQKCMYELFGIVDGYFGAVGNSKELPFCLTKMSELENNAMMGASCAVGPFSVVSTS